MAKVCAAGAEACFDMGVQAQSATAATTVAKPARRHLSKNWRIWSSPVPEILSDPPSP